MTSVSVTTFTRCFICTVFICAIAGCGSSNSTAGSKTGSIAAKLTWSDQASIGPAKTLYAAPAGVTTIKVFVSATDMATIVKDFSAADNSGTIDGIPVGTGRTVKAQGLDASATIRYQGTVSGITVNSGTTNPPVSIMMHAPVTTASPAGGSYNYPLSVTLSASDPATIYYTTDGSEPRADNLIFTHKGTSPFDIQLPGFTTLKFFAIDSGFAQEATKTEEYR